MRNRVRHLRRLMNEHLERREMLAVDVVSLPARAIEIDSAEDRL